MGLLYIFILVEAIGAYSNYGHLSQKWSDLHERIAASPPRPRLSGQDAPKPRSKRFLTDAETADIASCYRAGESTQQIGAHYGISKTRVATILREQGITLRRQGLTDEQAREAIRLYRTGQSLARLGIHFGVSHATIANVLRRQGVQLRPRPGWV